MLYAKKVGKGIDSPPPKYSTLLENEFHTVSSTPSSDYKKEYLSLLDVVLESYVKEVPWLRSSGGTYSLEVSYFSINIDRLAAYGDLIKLGKSSYYTFVATGAFYSNAQYEVIYFPKTAQGSCLVFPGLNKSLPIVEGSLVIFPSTHYCAPLLKISNSSSGWLELVHSSIYVKGTDIEREDQMFAELKQRLSEQKV